MRFAAVALTQSLAGVSRNEETLQPTVYLNKLPDSFQPDTRVLVADPMLATGAHAFRCHAVPRLSTCLCAQVGRCAPV